MNNLLNVSFPYLNLHFSFSRIAFNFGTLNIYWYGIILSLAFLTAFFYVNSDLKNTNITKTNFLDILIVGLICGIVGARLYYVAFYPDDYYFKNPLKIFCIHEGGIAIYGALMGAMLGGYITAKIKKIDVKALGDLCALGFLIGQSIGRWGNFFNQEAFGSETNFILAMSSENTFQKPVHPCFLYESLWCALGFVVLHIFYKKSLKNYKSCTFWLCLLWQAAGRIFIEHLRSDSLLIINTNLKVSQLLAIIIVMFSVFMLTYNYKKYLE